ncbi:MAG: hypothetical protein ACP5JE_03860 [Thermoplasmata archaeon]
MYLPQPYISVLVNYQNVAPLITPPNLPTAIVGPAYEEHINVNIGNYNGLAGLNYIYTFNQSNSVDLATVSVTITNNNVVDNLPISYYTITNLSASGVTNGLAISFSTSVPLEIVPQNVNYSISGDIISINSPLQLSGNYVITNAAAPVYNNGIYTYRITAQALNNPNFVNISIPASGLTGSGSLLMLNPTISTSGITIPARFNVLAISGTTSITAFKDGSNYVALTAGTGLMTNDLLRVTGASGPNGALILTYPFYLNVINVSGNNVTAYDPTSQLALNNATSISYIGLDPANTVTGTAEAYYRGLMVFPNSIYTFSDINTVTATVGPISTNNPAALALYFALANSIAPVYYIPIPSDNDSGYLSVWNTILASDAYTIVPLTTSVTTLQAYSTYANNLLNSTTGGWNLKAPIVTQQLLTAVTVAQNLTGTISANRLTIPAAFAGSILTGYMIQILNTPPSAGSINSVTAVITQYSNGIATLNQTFGVTVNNVVYNILRPATVQDQANDWASPWAPQTSEVNVLLPDTFTTTINGTTYTLPMYYAAAGLAGAIGSLPPQVQFNGYEIVGVESLTHSTGYFTEQQIGTIAGSGKIMLVTPTAFSGTPYVRNQVNTDMTNLATSQLSVRKNIDYTRRGFAQALQSMLKGYNVVQDAYIDINIRVNSMIKFYKSQRVYKAGPVIMAGSLTSISGVGDTVYVTVSCDYPAPLNGIVLTINASVG